MGAMIRRRSQGVTGVLVLFDENSEQELDATGIAVVPLALLGV